MLFLMLAILCNAVVPIVTRFSEGRVKSKINLFAVNYVACLVLAFFHTEGLNVFPRVEGFNEALICGLVDGVLYISGLLLIQYNVNHGGVVLTSVFSRLGELVLPIIVAVCVFGEIPKTLQVIGAVLAVISIIAINYDKELGKKKTALLSVIALFALFFADGGVAAMSKIMKETAGDHMSPYYLFYTFLMALFICIVIAVVKKERPGVKEILYGVGMGIPNFFAARFLLKALESVPAVIAYPTWGVLGILVTTLAGVIMFKERLKAHQWVSMGAILVSVVLLNL